MNRTSLSRPEKDEERFLDSATRRAKARKKCRAAFARNDSSVPLVAKMGAGCGSPKQVLNSRSGRDKCRMALHLNLATRGKPAPTKTGQDGAGTERGEVPHCVDSVRNDGW